MARPGTPEQYMVAKDPSKRLVVQRGFAELDASGRKVKSYDIKSLLERWEEWPTLSLVEFGRYWGIPYGTITSRKYPFSVAKKRKLQIERQAGYRAQVLGRVLLGDFVDESDERRSLRSLLRRLDEVGQAGIIYASERMIKRTEAGRVVNMALPRREAKQYMDIAQKAAQVLAVFTNIREMTKGDVGDLDYPTSRTDPRPVTVTVETKGLPARTEEP